MRYGFVTCVRLGEACIREILSFGGRLDVLVTLSDDRAPGKAGRVYLDAIAQEHGIPLHKIANINEPDSLELLRALDLDWLFIIGWSQIAGPDVLASARRGVLGMHPTLLPEGRGRASIPWAILKRLDRTGVTLFRLDEGMDTGPIIAQQVIPLESDETATALYERVVDAHRALLRRVWPNLEADTVVERVQDDAEATEWPGREPGDGEVLPSRMTIEEVDCLVRATTRPYPGAFLRQHDGGVLRIWKGRPLARGGAVPGRPVISLPDGDYLVEIFDIEPAGEGTVT